MDTSKLKKFAPEARRMLMSQVASKMKAVLAEGSAASRENPQAVKELLGQTAAHGDDQVIEQVAYTWFNRFSALRFMDANGYNSIGIVSPADGQTRPEILAEAAAGHIDEEIPAAIRQQVTALLDGRTPSRDPQAEAYRLLLVAICNQWHGAMPFMFEKIADFTELLMPEDLLSADSVLARMREVMTQDACKDVEIIGWLYQFYISEKKDQVFAGLKKNKKITAENIPAATQLFTPHWIVRYLVENSLGRLWMLNRPNSKLIERMDYYIKPEVPEKDFLRISSPEEIKVCDPACGSGHMLTYSFDLLYAIYEEEGHDAADIPEKILTNNLFGIEIDNRAGALAAFALTMKARSLQRRFFRREVQPSICVLENVSFADGELKDYEETVGRDLFTMGLHETLGQFEEAKNFGSLIAPKVEDMAELVRVIAARDFGSNLFLRDVHARVRTVLRMVDYLRPKYHVVVANPPYMGGKGMNPKLGDFAKENYPDSKSDLFAMFMDRAMSLTMKQGLMAMINMQAWMFLSSLEGIRTKVLSYSSILSMLHLGPRAFDSIGGEIVSTTAFILHNKSDVDYIGTYIRLVDLNSENEKSEAIRTCVRMAGARVYRASIRDFQSIPGTPLAYWAPKSALKSFAAGSLISGIAVAKSGQNTGDNARFVRNWHEVYNRRIGFGLESLAETNTDARKWYPYNKGGAFRKWYGNFDFVINWQNDGREVKEFAVKRNGGKHWSRYIQNLDLMLREGVTWTFISSTGFGARYTPKGHLFDYAGCSAFTVQERLAFLISAMCSSTSIYFLRMLNPTLNLQPGNVSNIPLPNVGADVNYNSFTVAAGRLIEISKTDWDSRETSWDFTTLPLLEFEHRQPSLAQTYAHLRAHWRNMTEEMQRLEEKNNRVFIDAYGLQDELASEVPLEDITLTSNPAYRYGGKKMEAELEARMLADTVSEFLSYAVGCMFGRYALDTPGLILANGGEGIEQYLAKVPNPTFIPDADNVIPVLDGDWFADDITERFRKFLRVTFGEERFAENLAFIENALGKDVRKYFTRDFYNDHVMRYKKRPIYWMFSSPKGTFSALIYMHRYRPDTVSIVLNGYLREYRTKLEAERRKLEALSISPDASQSEKTHALKEIQRLGPMIDELHEYERETLFPLATQKIEIDLDDGVKANYPKFGGALKPIKGLADVEE